MSLRGPHRGSSLFQMIPDPALEVKQTLAIIATKWQTWYLPLLAKQAETSLPFGRVDCTLSGTDSFGRWLVGFPGRADYLHRRTLGNEAEG